MRILVLSPVDLKHAAHNRLHDLIGQLSLRNKIDVICTYAWWLQEDGADSYTPEYYSNCLDEALSRVNINYLSAYRENPILQELLWVKRGKRVQDKVQLDSYDIIFNYNTILSGLITSHKLPSIPMVLDLADDIAAMAAESKMVPLPLGPIVEPFSRFALGLSVKRSKIVTVATEVLIDSFKIPRDKTRIVPNGVDTTMFRRQDQWRAKRRFNLDGRLVIGYVGVLREWVDFEMLLGAILILRNSGMDPYLLIVGSEGRMDEFIRMISEMRLEDRVMMTGTLPYSQVPEAISAMDVAVIPFKLNEITRNALPLKLFEYMACGAPVISQRLKPIIDVVGDNILYASDARELAERIQALLSSDGLRSEIAQRGLSIIKSDWNWETIGKKIETILATVVSEQQ